MFFLFTHRVAALKLDNKVNGHRKHNDVYGQSNSFPFDAVSGRGEVLAMWQSGYLVIFQRIGIRIMFVHGRGGRMVLLKPCTRAAARHLSWINM